MGEHQLTIRDYLRHSNLNVTKQPILSATPERLAFAAYSPTSMMPSVG
jgi:hypothetical protein